MKHAVGKPGLPRAWVHFPPFIRLVEIFVPVCLVLLSISLIGWIGSVEVIGDVLARTVSLDLPDGLRDDLGIALAPQHVTITGASQITRGGKSAGDAGYITFDRKNVTLASVAAEPGSTVVLTSGQDTLGLRIQGAGGNFALTVADTADGDGESVTAKAVGAEKAMSLSIPNGTTLSFDEFTVGDMRFGQPRGVVSENEPSFSSSVLSGSITVVGSQRTEPLVRGSALRLQGFKGSVVGLQSGPDGIHVWFAGKVDDIHAGTRDDPVSLWPAYIDIIYHWRGVKFAAAVTATILTILAAMGQWQHASKSSS